MAENQSISAVIGPVAGSSSSSSSPSGGLACAIAALAERQQMGGESSSNPSTSEYDMLSGCNNRYPSMEEQESENFHPPSGEEEEASSPNNIQLSRMTEGEREWLDNRSEMADVGSDGAEEEDITASSSQDEHNRVFQPMGAGGQIVPESFEEQMMLAMAVSLAEARARTTSPGVAWH